MTVEDPLAVVAGNHFEGRFTEQPSETSLNYINLPRARRILPVDALSWVAAFNAGYEPRLDCTAVRQKLFPLDELLQFHLTILPPIHIPMKVEVPYKGGELSLVLLLPGRTNQFLAGGLAQLEEKIDSDSWDRLLG